MGGRMASMVADELAVAGLICLGYPFHAPGRPESPRIAHLQTLTTPALILQGTRDPFGGEDEVGGYGLSPAIRLQWLGDGDHDLKPRKGSGRTQRGNWEEALEAIEGFLAGIKDRPAKERMGSARADRTGQGVGRSGRGAGRR